MVIVTRDELQQAIASLPDEATMRALSMTRERRVYLDRVDEADEQLRRLQKPDPHGRCIRFYHETWTQTLGGRSVTRHGWLMQSGVTICDAEG